MKITENLPENFTGTLQIITKNWGQELTSFQIKEKIKPIPLYIFLFQFLTKLYEKEDNVNMIKVIDLLATHREIAWKEESDKKIEEVFGKEFTIKLTNGST